MSDFNRIYMICPTIFHGKKTVSNWLILAAYGYMRGKGCVSIIHLFLIVST